MAIEIDAASPAIAVSSSADTVTTTSFTRPEGGLLVAMVTGLSSSDHTVSGGSLTWTRRVQRIVSGVPRAEIWTAPVTGSGSMTVTASGAGSYNAVALKVDCVVGQHATDPIGNSGNNVSSTNNLTVTGYTSSADGSRGFGTAMDGNGMGAPTTTDTGFPWHNTTYPVSGIAVRKSSNTALSDSAVSFNFDAGGSGTPDWGWVALEIKPAVYFPPARAVLSRAAVHRAASW